MLYYIQDIFWPHDSYFFMEWAASGPFLSLSIFDSLLIAAVLVTWEGGRAAFSSGLCLVVGWRDSGGASTTSSRLRDCHELRPGLRPPHPPNLLSAPTIRQTHFWTGGQCSNFINFEEILQPILSTFHRQILPYSMWRASIVISLVLDIDSEYILNMWKFKRDRSEGHLRYTNTNA